MKKLKFIAFSLIAVISLTGCGTKTLTCTKAYEESGLDMEQQVTMKFKGDKVQTIEITLDNTATDDTVKEYWDTFVSILDSQFEETNEDGVKVETEKNNEKYSYKISMGLDLTKANEDVLEKYGFDEIADKNSDIDTIKANAEKDGYTCK